MQSYCRKRRDNSGFVSDPVTNASDWRAVGSRETYFALWSSIWEPRDTDMRSTFPSANSACSAVFALVLWGTVAQAGPCTDQIAALEQQISALAAAPPPSGAGEPSAPQTIGAQLHHQPTPGTVENAERKASAGGDAALARAREADASGNADACDEALREARHLYGID